MMPESHLVKNKEGPLSGIDGLVCAFSRRSHGNMSLSYGDTKGALKNRKNFLESLGIDYKDLVCAKQIHSNQIRYVQDEDRGKGALSYDTAIGQTDAFITDKKNLPLAIFTADCLFIFLYDFRRPAIGLIHAGWRSSQENIAARTVELMQEKFDTQAQDLCVGFGPAIRSCCYEVGEEFKDFFPKELVRKNGHYYLDLVAINKMRLLSCGVKETNIFDTQICTSCQNKEFFSYRKDGKSCGRMMSVMML